MAGGNRYVGARPNTDGSLTDKKWNDDRWKANAITTKYVSDAAKVEAASTTEDSSPMVDKVYVDGRDALLMKKTAVDTADDALIKWSELGRPNGPIPLGPDNKTPVYVAYSDVLKTDRVATASGGSTFLSTDTDVVSASPKAYLAASLTVTSPGYPYCILPFASVLGRCTAQSHGPRRTGGGSYGRLSVITQGDLSLGGGVAGAQLDWTWAHAVPHATTQAPGNSTVFNDSTTVNLWLSLWSGTSYTFTSNASTPLSFWVLAVPAL